MLIINMLLSKIKPITVEVTFFGQIYVTFMDTWCFNIGEEGNQDILQTLN